MDELVILKTEYLNTTKEEWEKSIVEKYNSVKYSPRFDKINNHSFDTIQCGRLEILPLNKSK